MALSKILENSITDGVVSSAKLKDFTAAVDLNGVELILDADQDTSITADTDDRIDFKIANTDHISIGTSLGDTVIKPMTDAKDIIFQQYDGNKILEINDGNYVGIGGNAAGAGEIRIYEDTDDGTHYTGFKAGNNTESIAYTLPTADAASSGQALVSNASGVLSWATVSANTPTSADGQALGSASLEWSDLFLADGGTIQFGNDQDVTLTHVADTGLLLNSTMQLQFNDASQYINAPSATVLDINATDEIELNATAVDLNATLDVSGTSQFNSTVTVGVNDTGYDVKFFGATSGKSFLWDESADTLIVTGTTNLVGTTNLDAVDIDGAVQLDSTLTVGANDQGYDIIIYGDTASANMTWDTSVDDLIFNGAARIVIPDGQLVLGSTAVTSTAAELNLLDGVSGLVQADLTKLAAIDATAAEINLIDGGTSRGTDAVASGDGLLVNDGGTMKMTNVDTVSTYFASHSVGGGNIVTTGALNSGSITSGFGTIDTGSSTITTTGLISGGSLDIDNVLINGTTIGHTDDTDLMTVADGLLTVAGEISVTTLDIGGTNVTTTAAEINLIDGGTARGTTAVADGDGILHNDGGTMRMTSAATFKTYFQEGISQAYDDFTVGDAAVNVTTSAGDITIDAQGNDTDIIFKGTDGGADTTFLTIDGSAAGAATFNNNVTVGDNLILNTDAAQINFGADGEYSLIHNHDTGLILKSNATGDDTYPVLNLQTGQTDINDNDYLGFISFNAPDEGTGTDAITTAASIYARAEAEFSSSVNKTKLVFQTASSGAAVDRLTITGDGLGRSSFTAAAWANIDMNNTSGAANDSFNISGVTDNAVGKHTISFDVDLSYSYVGAAGMADGGYVVGLDNRAVGSVQLVVKESSGGQDADRDGVSFVVHDSI